MNGRSRVRRRLVGALMGTLLAAVGVPGGVAVAQLPVVSEDFAGADGSAWNVERWEIHSLDPATDVVDIQGGRGRITVGADTVAPHARPRLTTADVSFTVEEPAGPEPARWTAFFTAGSDQLGTAYLVRKNNTEATLTLYRQSDTVLIPLGEAAVAGEGGPVRVRYQLTADAVRVRTWAAGASEPATWDIDVAEAVPPDDRQFAFVARTQTSPVYPTPAPKTWHLDDVQISGELAAGAPAPAPGPGADLTLEPESATALVGESHTVTATVPAEVGAAGTGVIFEVYRESVADAPETGTVRQLVETTVVTSDESGTATHSYSAAEAGVDWIVACAAPQGERCTTGDQDTGIGIEPRADIPAASATVTWQVAGPAGRRN